jgi:hypothetical protein
MTELMKAMLFALLLGAVLTSTSIAQSRSVAQTITVELIAVGDETQFDTWAQVAHAVSGANNNYTIAGIDPNTGGFYAAMNDVRASDIPLERGGLWVVWDAAMSKVWCYLNTDSNVATRGFFAVPRAQLLLDPALLTTPGQNLEAGLPPDAAALPKSIFNAINNAPWDAIMTVNVPKTNWTENNKILAVAAAPPKKYGYGPDPFKYEILSSVSSKYRTPVVFNVTGADPITGQAIPPYKATAMRKSLVIPLVNATNTGPGGIGSFIAANHNVTEPCGTLSTGLSGDSTTTQLFGVAGPGNLLNVFLDDPLDGPWYEMETKIYLKCAAVKSQETGVIPPANDPLMLTNPGISLRERVLGQGLAYDSVSATPDSVSYVSWTCNTLAGLGTYVEVNNINPFLGGWTGVFPSCSATADVDYPLITTQELITDTPIPASISALIKPVNNLVTARLAWQ